MLIIRLQRVGKKNEPTFRIVLTDSKNGPKSGKFLEILGSYDARDKNESKVDADRVKELIANGAQVSDTVRNFLITKGVIEGDKVNVLPKKTPIVKEAEEGEESPKEETGEAPATEEKTAEDAPAEESAKEETPVEEPVKEEEAPAQDAPIEEINPEENSPEAPAEETSVPEEAKTEEAPAEEAPKEETPAESEEEKKEA
jgi:small subunit ribosomal protein S16